MARVAHVGPAEDRLRQPPHGNRPAAPRQLAQERPRSVDLCSGRPPVGRRAPRSVRMRRHDVPAQRLLLELELGEAGYRVELAPAGAEGLAARQHLAGRYGVASCGSADEHPLGERALRELTVTFSRVYVSFPVFRFFELLNRVFHGKLPPLTVAFRLLDQVAALVPGLRRYSYQMLIRVER